MTYWSKPTWFLSNSGERVLSMLAQTNSIGLRSGLHGGHRKTSTCFDCKKSRTILAVCYLALSCWKTILSNPPNCASIDGSPTSSSTFKYANDMCFLIRKNNLFEIINAKIVQHVSTETDSLSAMCRCQFYVSCGSMASYFRFLNASGDSNIRNVLKSSSSCGCREWIVA